MTEDHDTDVIASPAAGPARGKATRPWARRPAAYALTAAVGIACGLLIGWMRTAGRPAAKAPAAPAAAARPVAAPESGPEAEFRRRVEFGNLCYEEAVARLKKSDPAVNRAGWAQENDAALELLERARDHYNEALALREDPAVMRRLQDVQFKMSLARKRKDTP